MEQTKPEPTHYVFIWSQTETELIYPERPRYSHLPYPFSGPVNTGSTLPSIVYLSDDDSLHPTLRLFIHHHTLQSELQHHRPVHHPLSKNVLLFISKPLVLQKSNQQLRSQLKLDQSLPQEYISKTNAESFTRVPRKSIVVDSLKQNSFAKNKRTTISRLF